MQSKLKQRKQSSKGSVEQEKSSNVTKSKVESSSSRIHTENEGESTFKIDYKRIIIRCLLIIGIISLVSLNQKNNVETFASQKEEITKKDVIQCSKDYAEELNKFPGCVPRKCGRFVSDAVISLGEVQALLVIAQKGFAFGSSGGGASILDLHSGALSQGEAFVNIYAINKTRQIITKEDLKVYSHIKNKIKTAIVKNFGVKHDRLYLTHPTFFSRITSLPARTIHDEYWHPHVDKETYQSFHYTSLLYLTDYNHHFKGGRFIFIDEKVNKTVEPRAGRLSAFTSGSENLHYVEQVTSGTRFAITVSFTCDPSKGIKDPQLPE